MKKLFVLIIFILSIYGIYQLAGKIGLIPASEPKDSGYSTVTIGNMTYSVDLADDDNERVQGLSGRINLPSSHGLLFIFNTQDIYAFWMKDMLFPIDIIWIDGDKIVDITKNAPVPETATYLPRYQPKSPVNKVLEVNAGEADKHRFTIGQTVSISLLKPISSP